MTVRSESAPSRVSRGLALLVLLGGPGVVLLQIGGWIAFVIYAVLVLPGLFAFDLLRARWTDQERSVIWFDLGAALIGALVTAFLLRV